MVNKYVTRALVFHPLSASPQAPLPALGRLCLSESVGTFLLVFLGPASIVLASSAGLTPFEAQEAIAAVFGCTVAGVIILLGSVSGAHINPAVTVASAAAGRLEPYRFVPYILSQIAGAIVAGLALRLAFEQEGGATSLGSTKLAASISPLEGVALEIFGTFVLAMSALVAGHYLRTYYYQGILVGATLFCLITLIGPLTGASFNPARSLGPSLFSGYLTNQLIYYVGPVVGGASAGLLFGRIVKSARSGHE